ncbi:MAG: S-layer homology domain-containing protein [Carboxydocellales bacterium]
MKRILLILVILAAQFLSITGTAWAIYTPPGNPVPSKADIAEAERVMNGLKWDLSQASKGTIKLTIPDMNKNYCLKVEKDAGTTVGIGLVTPTIFDNFYTNGLGKILVFNGVRKPVGFYFDLASKLNGRVLAYDLYIYTPEQGVKYILPKERISVITDDKNEISGWLDINNNPINEDGTPITTEPKPQVVFPFKDILGHWALKDIVALKDANFINGYPYGSFKPENTITRAEFMVMLGRIWAIKYPDAKTYIYESLFIDDLNHWSYKEAVKSFGYLQSIDITHIFLDNYIPDQPITREEVVAVLNAILKNNRGFQYTPTSYLVLKDTDTSRFPDSIVFSSKYNLVNGYPDGAFKPTGKITRAEISSVLVRMLNKLQ